MCVPACARARASVHWLTPLTADIAHYNLNDFLTGPHFHTQSQFLDVCECLCESVCVCARPLSRSLALSLALPLARSLALEAVEVSEAYSNEICPL